MNAKTDPVMKLSTTKPRSEWIALLAADCVRRYPDLYRGFEADAVTFVTRQHNNRYYMALAAVNAGLVTL